MEEIVEYRSTEGKQITIRSITPEISTEDDWEDAIRGIAEQLYGILSKYR